MAEIQGKFYCPKCCKTNITLWNGKGVGYSIWICKEINNTKKWKFSGVTLNGGVYILTEENCWKTEEERNKYVKWFCSNCKFNSRSFTDYIRNKSKTKENSEINKINELEHKLDEERQKRINLENELKYSKNRVNILENELKKEKVKYKNLEALKNLSEKEKYILDKENEINNLKTKLSRYPCDLNFNEKLISIIFITSDQKVHHSIICKNTDNFKIVKDKLFENYPEYKKIKLLYTSNGHYVDESKSLEENKIKNNDIIICNTI